VAAVYSQKGKQHMLRSAEIRRPLQLLDQEAADPEARLSWAVRLSDEGLSTTLAVGLLVQVYADRPSGVAKRVVELAEDDNWERREDAAWLLSELLASHFEDVYEQCVQWVRHPSANVRRCVAVAVKRAAKGREPERGERFLDLLEPLLTDRDEYVRKNLGPFAIGDGLLRCYPALTLSRLESWSQRRNEETRWNVAMAFSTAEGAKHLDSALHLLTPIAADERRFVWRAVASAMRNLGRRHREAVRPVLEGWLKDERRRHVAEVALGYVDGP
jgi:3-methyladenine DNA glycosylase AlkC